MSQLVITSWMVRVVVALVTVTAASVTAARPVEGLVALPERPEVPELSLIDWQGRHHDLSDYRGRLVLVNFWAVWCGSCREEFPAMARVYEELKDDGITLLAVNSGDSRKAVAGVLEDYPLPFPVLMDRDSEAAGAWQVQGLPTTYVVTPDGHVYGGAVGARDWDSETMLAQLRHLADALGAE